MLYLKPKLVEGTSVSGDPVIRVVPSNLSDKHLPLRLDGQVPVTPTPEVREFSVHAIAEVTDAISNSARNDIWRARGADLIRDP